MTGPIFASMASTVLWLLLFRLISCFADASMSYTILDRMGALA
jgi:hypothetical protein